MTLLERMSSTSTIHDENFDPSTLYSWQTTDKKYKLMIKTHWETGVNYLCITKRTDFRKYPGSGIRWRALLKARPGPVFTYLLFSTDLKEELSEACLYYSDYFNIPENDCFANLIPESGYSRDPDAIIIYDKLVASQAGQKGGIASRDKQLGIHDPKNKDSRSDWAKAGAQGLEESGNRSGVFSKEWKEQNPEISSKLSSDGGKVGGIVTGKMPWWNNGIENTRSNECPGEYWISGMLVSDKKKAQLLYWGQSKPTEGKKCINNGIRNKMVKPEEIDQYISEGWISGKIKIKKENHGK